MVPLTESEKAEERLEKVRSHQAGKGDGRPPPGATRSGAGVEGVAQQPVEFVHIKTPGRNYAVLQVGRGFLLALSVCGYNVPFPAESCSEYSRWEGGGGRYEPIFIRFVFT